MANDTFRFAAPISIRFRDLDAFGHVNNAVYFTYMEVARVDYFRQLGLLADDFPSPFFIIAEAACQFKAPILMTTPLSVRARVSRLGTSSFDMDYHFVDGATGRLLAVGRTVQVMFDYAAGRPVALPDRWRQTLSDFEVL
ncbi:MAG TPA: thioesterase family protein [Anaerolineae bacterium]|nr:thioesterase family protein [Anaerolineae bacterium]